MITLITGTSTGIGLATALHFARKGHQVYATMRNPSGGSRLLRESAESEGLQVNVSQLDVDDPASVKRAVSEIEDEAGQIDVLVNNAGIGNLSVIERTTDEAAKAIFETNYFGALRTIRAVLPGMRERRNGTIVNVSSVAGLITWFCQGVYSSSKHALEAASDALALEVHKFGIRVAIIEPGFFGTPLIEKAVAMIPADEASPYADHERRMRDLFGQGAENAADPQVVAQAVEHAVTTTEPKLRYLVGDDAPVFLDGRRRMSDEEYLGMGREMSDEDYWQEFQERFPL